jgi:thiamine biosynthesis lipoprotein ApbE
MQHYFYLTIFGLFLGLTSCDSAHKGVAGRSYSGMLLGKKYDIDTPGDTIDRTPIIDSVFTAFETIFNTSDSQSLLSRFNNFNRSDTVFVMADSTRLFGIVYDVSSDLHQHTQGSWNPATAPLRRNLLSAGSAPLVSDSILALCEFTEFSIRMQEHFDEQGGYVKTTILKRNPYIELDFSDIASAIAVDYLAEAFLLHNIKTFRICHDGDTRCHGLSRNEIGLTKLGLGDHPENPVLDIGEIAFARRDLEDKKNLVDPNTGYPSVGPVVYSAVVSPYLSEARIFSQALLLQDLNSIADYYKRNPESKVNSFIFFQQGDSLQNASTTGFDKLIISNSNSK